MDAEADSQHDDELCDAKKPGSYRRHSVPRDSKVSNGPKDSEDSKSTGSFDPWTGADLGAGEWIAYSPAQQAGLDAPRYCPECGRRRIVQVTPHGWTALCSRHGESSGATDGL